MTSMNVLLTCLALAGSLGGGQNWQGPVNTPPYGYLSVPPRTPHGNLVMPETGAWMMYVVNPHLDQAPRACVAASCCTAAAEDKVVKELVQIMDETKSPQTVLAVTLALMPMGKKAQSAVPAILRNAERLKMLTPLKDMNSAKADNSTILLTAVMAIQMDMRVTRDMIGFGNNGPFNLDRGPGAAPSSYGCPAPGQPYPSSPVCPMPPPDPGR